MVEDQLSIISQGQKIIEVLIEDKGIKLWIPAMATDLRIMNKERELVKVKGLRVRKFTGFEQKENDKLVKGK